MKTFSSDLEQWRLDLRSRLKRRSANVINAVIPKGFKVSHELK